MAIRVAASSWAPLFCWSLVNLTTLLRFLPIPGFLFISSSFHFSYGLLFFLLLSFCALVQSLSSSILHRLYLIPVYMLEVLPPFCSLSFSSRFIWSRQQLQPLKECPAYLSLRPSIPLFSAPPWHSSLSLVLSSQTHGFNFGLPASLSPAILYLVSSQAFACICVRMCDDHIMNVCAPKRHLKLIIKLYIVNKGLVAFQTWSLHFESI